MLQLSLFTSKILMKWKLGEGGRLGVFSLKHYPTTLIQKTSKLHVSPEDRINNHMIYHGELTVTLTNEILSSARLES